MDDERVKVEIQCDDRAVAELRELLAPDDRPRFVERRSLSGDPATWVVLATLAASAIPQLLTLVLKWREQGQVRKIKVGDVEVENPTDADLEMLRQLIAARTKSGDAP
jgi:hypothetical protein